MANSQDILLTYKTDTGEVTKSLDEIASGLEGVDKKLDETAKGTQKVGAGLKASGKAGAIGFKAIGAAIAATGIGLLVQIVATLIQKFTENKKVAEALEVVFAGIGAVINTLFEVVEPLGDVLMNAFNNPMETIKNLGKIIKENIINRFEGMLEFLPAIGKAISLVFKGEFAEAGKVAADAAGKMVLGVENVTDKIVAAGEAIGEFATDFVASAKKSISSSNDLIKAQQRLRDQQRDLNVEYAQARAEIEQLKQKRDDERLSIEERIAAAQEASDLDQEFADKREAIANREVALVQREIELQGETVERLDQLAEARIAAAEAAESSAAVQTELMTSIIGLQNEQIAKNDEIDAAEAERVADIIARQEEIDAVLENQKTLEILRLQDKYREMRRLAAQQGQTLAGDLEAERIELEAINSKYDAIDIANAKAVFDSRVQFATQALGALAALNEAFSGSSEKQQKKAFQRNKAIGISTAIISTAGAIIGALNPALNGGLALPVALPGALIAAATGAAQIAVIAKSRFKSGGASTPPGPSGVGGGGAGAPPTSPQLDLSFLGGGAGQTGFRTYVIASEVSNSQQANQKINDQAALVG
jgi:hypothetical protein